MRSRPLCVVTMSLALVTISIAQNASTVVRTESGLVRGVTEGEIRAFRGIPFGAPPLDHLRWRPPLPPRSWSGIRDTSTFGNACMQIASSGDLIGNEDWPLRKRLHFHFDYSEGTPAGDGLFSWRRGLPRFNPSDSI